MQGILSALFVSISRNYTVYKDLTESPVTQKVSISSGTIGDRSQSHHIDFTITNTVTSLYDSSLVQKSLSVEGWGRGVRVESHMKNTSKLELNLKSDLGVGRKRDCTNASK